MDNSKSKIVAFYTGIFGLILSGAFTWYLSYNFSKFNTTLNLFLLMYVAFSFLGFLFYVFKRDQTVHVEEALSENVYKAFSLLFLLVIVGILFVLRSSLYTKPLSYYILVSLGTALIGIQIIGKGRSNIILIQIGVLALLLRSSSFIINPYLYGPDSYWHFNMIQNIIRDGHLSNKAGHYYYFPSFHLLISFLEKIVMPDKIIYSVGGLILSLTAILAIYLLTREIFGERIGLMSSLLLTISSFHLFASINNHPMGQAVSLILISLYIITKFSNPWRTSEYVRTWGIFWMVALFVFFIHPVASMALGLILGANYVVTRLIFKNSKGLTPVYSYVIGFIAYLMFVAFSLFREIVEVLLIPGESHALPSVPLVAPVKEDLSLLLLESSLSFLGPTALIFFAIYGGLKLLEKPDPKKMAILLPILFLYVIPFLSFLRGSGGLDPGRLLIFIEALIIIPAAYALVYLSSTIQRLKYKFALIFSILIFLAFFSTTSYITWDGNSVLKSGVVVPIGFVTQSTLAINPFVEKLSVQKPTYTDDITNLYIYVAERSPLMRNQKTEPIHYSALKNEGYFVVNNLILELRMWSTEKDKTDFFKRIGDIDRIYDNGNVQVFERMKE